MTTEQYEADIKFVNDRPNIDWTKPETLRSEVLAVLVRNVKVREIIGWRYAGGTSVVADCLEEAARRLELMDKK